MAAKRKPRKLVSPTGKPLVPAAWVPYFSAGATVCVAVAGASQLQLGLPASVANWAMLGAVVFAALLGTTPGARK